MSAFKTETNTYPLTGITEQARSTVSDVTLGVPAKDAGGWLLKYSNFSFVTAPCLLLNKVLF